MCFKEIIMLNRFKRTILFSVFSLLIICPATCFAWHDYNDYGDWNYHGSGRDHPYSAYIDRYYYIGYADYSAFAPDYVDWTSYINNITPPATQPEEFTVNIPNSRGGYNAVVIKRSGNGFTGPQGEYYPEFPKIFQLEMMYGK
jgi:hypothetical protein